MWQIVFLLALFLEVADGVGDSNEEVVGLSAEDCGEMREKTALESLFGELREEDGGASRWRVSLLLNSSVAVRTIQEKCGGGASVNVLAVSLLKLIVFPSNKGGGV